VQVVTDTAPADVLLSPFRFFVVANLVRADVDVDMSYLEVGRTRTLLDWS
jgi:hypothetical protein